MADVIKYVSQSNLNYYDGKIKEHIADADAALKTNLEGQLDVVSGALDGEIERAKAAEAENKAAAEAAQAHSEELAGKVGTVPSGKTVVGMISEAQASATYDDTEVRGLISGLDTNKADKTQVATDIAAAVKVEEDARKEAVSGVQGAVDALSGTHATDKKALEDTIALKADKTALEAEADRAKAEEARIEGLVAAEAERAADAEAELEERIETMEVFWDATEDSDGVVNKLKEIQDYIEKDETGAAAMAGNIQSNAQAISAMDAAYKAADVALQGGIDTLEDRMDTAEGKISANEQAIADLQEAVGDGGSVEDMIADAIDAEAALRVAGDEAAEASAAAALAAAQAAQAAADKAQGEVDSLEGVVATKAAQSDLTALAGRVTTAEGEIDTLQTEMDAVESVAAAAKAAAEANASAIALKASQADLEAEVSRATARENAIEEKIDAYQPMTQSDIDALF